MIRYAILVSPEADGAHLQKPWLKLKTRYGTNMELLKRRVTTCIKARTIPIIIFTSWR